MNRKIRLVCLIFLVLAVGAALFSSGCSSSSPSSQEPIKIGSLISMTGSFADYGPKFKAACEMKLDEIGYKIANRPVQFIWEDDQTSNDASLEKARKLVLQDKIAICVGGIFGSSLITQAPFWAEQKIPQITWHSQVYPDTVSKGWTFMPSIDQATSTYLSGVYAYQVMGAKTMSVIGADYASGYRFCGGMMQGFLDSGGKINQVQWAPTTTVDFGPYMAKVAPADVLGFWFPGAGTLLLLKQANEFGIKAKMPMVIGAGDTIWEEHLKELGDNALGVVGATKYTNAIDTSESKKFVEAWKTKTGRLPDSYDEQAYESISVAVGALQATNGDTNGEKLRQAILNLDLTLPAGKLKFSKYNTGIAPQYIIKVEKINGAIVRNPVKQYPAFEEPKLIQPGTVDKLK
jgi:branched-chain amino acid transport system substrate-binding protein